MRKKWIGREEILKEGVQENREKKEKENKISSVLMLLCIKPTITGNDMEYQVHP